MNLFGKTGNKDSLNDQPETLEAFLGKIKLDAEADYFDDPENPRERETQDRQRRFAQWMSHGAEGTRLVVVTNFSNDLRDLSEQPPLVHAHAERIITKIVGSKPGESPHTLYRVSVHPSLKSDRFVHDLVNAMTDPDEEEYIKSSINNRYHASAYSLMQAITREEGAAGPSIGIQTIINPLFAEGVRGSLLSTELERQERQIPAATHVAVISGLNLLDLGLKYRENTGGCANELVSPHFATETAWRRICGSLIDETLVQRPDL